MQVTHEDIVSSDVLGTAYNLVIPSTHIKIRKEQVRIICFYDNEWGYVNNVLALIRKLIALC